MKMKVRGICSAFSIAWGPAGGRGKTGKERQFRNLLLLLSVTSSSLEAKSATARSLLMHCQGGRNSDLVFIASRHGNIQPRVKGKKPVR